jgi:hypothetical protein
MLIVNVNPSLIIVSRKARAYDSYGFCFSFEFIGSELYLALGSCQWFGAILKVDICYITAFNIAWERIDFEFRVGLKHLNLVLEIDWAVWLDVKLLEIDSPQPRLISKVNKLRNLLLLPWINYWITVNRNIDCIPSAVNSDIIFIVSMAIVNRRSKLHVHFLR